MKYWDWKKIGECIIGIILGGVLISVLTLIIIGGTRESNHFSEETYQLDKVQMSSITQQEASGSFFLIWGSYNRGEVTGNRFMFLASNGPNNSWRLNDIFIEMGGRNRTEIFWVFVDSYEYSQLVIREEGRRRVYTLYLPRETVQNIIFAA